MANAAYSQREIKETVIYTAVHKVFQLIILPSDVKKKKILTAHYIAQKWVYILYMLPSVSQHPFLPTNTHTDNHHYTAGYLEYCDYQLKHYRSMADKKHDMQPRP